MNDAAADFRRIHETFRPKVRRYLARLAGESQADDLAQAVMLKVSLGLPRFRGEASLPTWIYRIATNTALDSRRRRREARDAPGATLADADEGAAIRPEAQGPSLEATAIREEMSACIREFVGRLPQTYRTVVLLADFEGFRNAEIADILGVSLDTVKIRLHRAREKLRRDLEAGCSFDRDPSNGLGCDRKPGRVP